MDIIWPCQIDFDESVSQPVNATRFTGRRRLIFLYQFFFFFFLNCSCLSHLFKPNVAEDLSASKRLLPIIHKHPTSYHRQQFPDNSIRNQCAESTTDQL